MHLKNPTPRRALTRGSISAALLGAAAALAFMPAGAQDAAEQAATIRTANSATLGTYLTDADGRTLYVFDQDSRTASACTDFCANTFPAYTVAAGTRPTTGEGAVTALAGTLKRDDGTLQVTYAGHPLYRFAGDTQAGGTAGNGKESFGGAWNALAPGGEVAVSKPAAASKHAAAQDKGAGQADGSTQNPFAGDVEAVAKGKELYLKAGCYACHGRGGGGGMGPSLVSGNWRYGGTDAILFQTITQGRPNGMPAWRTHFTDDQVWEIITFLRSLAS